MKKSILFLLLASGMCHADTIFLDNHSGVINGSTTYDPKKRTCGQGKCKVFTGLDRAARALSLPACSVQAVDQPWACCTRAICVSRSPPWSGYSGRLIDQEKSGARATPGNDSND